MEPTDIILPEDPYTPAPGTVRNNPGTNGPGPVPKPKPLTEDDLADFVNRMGADLAASDAKANTRINYLKNSQKTEYLSPSETVEANRYLSTGATYLRGRNNEAVAAANQGTWEKISNDLEGFGANALGSVLSAPFVFPQMFKAVTSLFQGEGLDGALTYLRGEEGSTLNDINQWQDGVNERAINYSSEWAKENKWKNMLPFYGGEGGSDFGSLARSSGFLVGGVVTGLAETALGTLVAPLTGGVSLALVGADLVAKLSRTFKSLATIGKSLDIINDAVQLERKAEQAYKGIKALNTVGKIWTGIDTPLGSLSTRSLIHGFLLSNGEASLEGFHTEKDTIARLTDEYRKVNGEDPDEKETIRIKQIAAEAGNSTFLLNQGLLAVTNKFQVDSILKNFTGAKSLFSNLSDDLFRVERKAGTGVFEAVKNTSSPITFGTMDKWYQKAFAKVATAGRAVSTKGLLATSEGIEESLQKAVSDGTQSYFDYKYNHNGKADLSKAIGYGLGQAFGTEEGWTEFVGGLVIGGLFGGGIQGITDYIKKPAIKAQFEAYARQMNMSVPALQSAVINQINTSVLNNNLVAKAAQANGQLQVSAGMAQAAQQGDQLQFQNQKNTGQFAFLQSFVNQGAGDILREQFGTFRSDIEKDAKAFAEGFGLESTVKKDDLFKAVNELEVKLGDLEKSNEIFKGRFPNPYSKEIKKLEKDGKAVPNELLQKQFLWNDYYEDILHNDFLRKQYGKRVGVLNSQSSILGDDVPYTSEEGWKRHAQLTKDRLTQLDQEMALAKREHLSRALGENENATDGLDKLEKDVQASQQKERDQLTKRLMTIVQLQSNGFGNYEDVLKAIKEDLLTDNKISRTTTDEELKELLQASFDANSLKDSIVKLSDLFNGLTSQNAFDTWVKKSEKYLAFQKSQNDAVEIQAKSKLKAGILKLFPNLKDAEFYLGPLDQYIDQNIAQFMNDPVVTLDTLTTEITEKLTTEKAKKQAYDDTVQAVLELAEEDDETIRIRQDKLDSDGKKLKELIEKKVLDNPGVLPTDLIEEIIRDYALLYPAKPVVEKPIDPDEVEIPLETPEQVAGLSPITGDDLFGEEPPAPPTPPVPVATKPVVNPVVRPPAKKYVPIQNRVFTKISDLGDLAGKFFNTAMTVIDDFPIWFNQDELEDDIKLSDEQREKNTANRIIWEQLAEDREFITNLPANQKLSDHVDWSLLEPDEDAVKAKVSKAKPLLQDPGLHRVTTPMYLVGTRKGNPDNKPFLVITIDESLFITKLLLAELHKADVLTLDQKRKLRLLPVHDTLQTPALTDVLSLGGPTLYEFLQKQGWINTFTKYDEFMDSAMRYREIVDTIVNTFNDGQITPTTVQLLNNLSLNTLKSKPFFARNKLPISKLVTSGFQGDTKLIVRLEFEKNTGKPIITHVPGDQADTTIVTEQQYNQLFAPGSAMLAKLTAPDTWKTKTPGMYLLVQGTDAETLRGGTSTYFPFRVVNDTGISNLLGLIKENKPFQSGKEGFFIVYRDKGGLVMQGEIVGNRLGGSDSKLNLMVTTSEGSYYSDSIPINVVQQGDEAVLQKELEKVLSTFKKQNTKEPLQNPPVTIDIQQGSNNQYERLVAVTSKAVFKRIDMNWNLLPVQPITGDEIEVLAPTTLPTQLENALPEPEVAEVPHDVVTTNLNKALVTLVDLGLDSEVASLINDELTGLPIDDSNVASINPDDINEIYESGDDSIIYSVAALLEKPVVKGVPTTRQQINPNPDVSDIVKELMRQCE